MVPEGESSRYDASALRGGGQRGVRQLLTMRIIFVRFGLVRSSSPSDRGVVTSTIPQEVEEKMGIC